MSCLYTEMYILIYLGAASYFYHYRPQTKFAKVMFLQVSVCPHWGWRAWFYLGGVHGFIRGRAWFYSGGMCGFIWGCAWFYLGGMRGFIGGACIVLFGRVCMVLFGGACVVLFGGAWFFQFFRIQ